MSKVREIDGYTLVMDYKSPRLSGEYYECGLPITFDQYNKCAFNCQYCFSAFVDVGHAHSTAKQRKAGVEAQSKYRNPVRSVNPEAVRRYWYDADKRGWIGVDAMLVNLIRKRSPVHWGGLCDPFDPFEERFQIGLELLHFWRALDWPVVFSTKGTLMMKEPWAEVLRGGNFRFQFSITTTDPAKGKIVDSGVGTPQQRFEAMRFVTKELGCVATLRLRPIIPGAVTPEECCELIRTAHANGATGVSTEFFCLESRGLANRPRYERMSVAAGFDLYEFYRRNSPKQSGYMRLNRAIKARYFLPMERVAKGLGMRFSVSDREFKELGNVSGCCGVYWNDETGVCTRDNHAAVHVNRGTVTYALIHAREHGRVAWSDIEPHLQWAKVELDSNVQGLMSRTDQRSKHRGQTLFEALRCQWNDPNHTKSPYRYSGGKVQPSGVDEHGDVIYVYVRDENEGMP